MIKQLFRFLGWTDRRPGDMWPFPFAGVEPRRQIPRPAQRPGKAPTPETQA